MNNVLLMPIDNIGVSGESDEFAEKPSYQIYNINDDGEDEDDNIFIMGYNYYTPYIIDFSRAFIYKSDNIDNKIISKELKEIYKKNMINIFKQELPDFYSNNKMVILYCIHECFQKFYKIFYAFDMYKFAKGFINILNNVKKETKFDEHYIENSHIVLMENIKSFANNFIKKYIFMLYEDIGITIPNVNKLIMKHFFSEYDLSNLEKMSAGKIKDTFNINNKIVTDISEKHTNIDMYKKEQLVKFGMDKYFSELISTREQHNKYLKTCDYDKKINNIIKDIDY